MNEITLKLGLDVGSTTVKAVVTDAASGKLLWQDCQRHETRQLEKVLEFLKRIEDDFPDVADEQITVAATGSGARALEGLVGARFVQEVNAVSVAVENRYPEVGSVVELGGQDAKIIIFKDDPKSGCKKKIPSMNDKCAGGTGAVLDKISAKLGIRPEELSKQGYDGLKLHHVAGKCGVFAETDVNSLKVQGIPNDQLMASLFQAIVGQNLSVLTRGHTLRPHVLLLGGPNTYIRGMQEAWRANIPRTWEERGYPLPEGVDPRSLISVPDKAQYFAALGAIEADDGADDVARPYTGWKKLERFLAGRKAQTSRALAQGLVRSAEELEAFKETYRKKPFVPRAFKQGERVEVFVGLDGGSTSTKAVLLNPRREVLAKAYELCSGNPIDDTKRIFERLRAPVESTGAHLVVRGVGVTGYAKDALKDILCADVAIVETVAHAASAMHLYRDVDVICDVGGQDIKIMILQNGKVKDFKLNTQCSAGNGYFLQNVAKDFGVPVEQYAEVAFGAEKMPEFSYGCAVFLQSDIVNFQRQGWKPAEIMAGLAAILPKNIWLYVAQIANFSHLGRTFVLQGGTQRNLAAVKAQVDFIRSKKRSAGQEPNIVVHEHCGESGAIGAAMESIRLWEQGRKTSFIGFDVVERMTYAATTSEQTICPFCNNHCQRTFIDMETESAQDGARRLITGNACEKGAAEDPKQVRAIADQLNDVLRRTDNFPAIAAKEAFKSFEPEIVSERVPRIALTRGARERTRTRRKRETLRIGIPRVLNVYAAAPLLTAYFESLGVAHKNIVFSDNTTAKLYREGSTRASIDPCFPSKLGIAHVHNLIFEKHRKQPLDAIIFPMLDDLPTDLVNTRACRVCPTITASATAVRAAFSRDGDTFAEKGIERQMYDQLAGLLGLSRKENARAVGAGYAALARYKENMRQRAGVVLRRLEMENQVGIVLLGRPYHSDPGINHDILRELQKRGYPIFTSDSLPIDGDTMSRLFGEEVKAGVIAHPLDISDVWKNTFNSVSNQKLWAAKFAARHPNLIALEVSSFRCGHDAPIYSAVEAIVESSGTPYFSFKDLDENKSSGSIKIRVETIDYFLRRHREELAANRTLAVAAG
jgi:activator of 2-hydroxyglutaryl-CoA dehydratase/predicted nucleotide-binding protein (sugar kinase/HSP70/actin superfamily)